MHLRVKSGVGVCPPVLIRERSSGPGVGYSSSDKKRKLETDVWVPHLSSPPLAAPRSTAASYIPGHALCLVLYATRACTLPGPGSYHWEHVISVMEGLSQPWETLDTEGSGGQPVRGGQRGVPCSPPPRPLSPALPMSSWLSRPENPCWPCEPCVRVSPLVRQGFLSPGAALGVHPIGVTCQGAVLTAPGSQVATCVLGGLCEGQGHRLVAFCAEAFVNR